MKEGRAAHTPEQGGSKLIRACAPLRDAVGWTLISMWRTRRPGEKCDAWFDRAALGGRRGALASLNQTAKSQRSLRLTRQNRRTRLSAEGQRRML